MLDAKYGQRRWYGSDAAAFTDRMCLYARSHEKPATRVAGECPHMERMRFGVLDKRWLTRCRKGAIRFDAVSRYSARGKIVRIECVASGRIHADMYRAASEQSWMSMRGEGAIGPD